MVRDGIYFGTILRNLEVKKIDIVGKFPTESDYLQMTAHKTGVLARLSTRLVCVALNIPYEQEVVLARLAEAMGVAFQIKDDLLNLEGEEYIKTKGFSGEDIHEVQVILFRVKCP